MCISITNGSDLGSLLSGIGTILLVIAGFIGINNWKTIKAKEQKNEVAVQSLANIFKFLDNIQTVCAPFIHVSEYYIIPAEILDGTPLESLAPKEKSRLELVTAYSNRIKNINDSIKNIYLTNVQLECIFDEKEIAEFIDAILKYWNDRYKAIYILTRYTPDEQTEKMRDDVSPPNLENDIKEFKNRAKVIFKKHIIR